MLLNRLSYWHILAPLFCVPMVAQGVGVLGVDPLATLMIYFGWVAVGLFILNQYLGIFAALSLKGFPQWLRRSRREMGVCSFIFIMVHGLILIGHRGGVSQIWEKDFESSFVWFGFLAALTLVPLALTSNDAAIRWLQRRWKQLHRMVYMAFILLAFHLLLNREAERIWVIVLFVPVFFGQLLRFFRKEFPFRKSKHIFRKGSFS